MSNDADQHPYGESAPDPSPYSGSYPPAYGQPGQPYGQPYSQPSQAYGQPAVPYASWGVRFGAYLLDTLLALAVMIVPAVIAVVVLAAGTTSTTDALGQTTSEVDGAAAGIALALFGLAVVLSIAFQVWNFVFRQGRTTQSLAKKWLGISVVNERTGQPIGTGAAFGRWLMHAYVDTLFGACIPLGFLWPLWDARKRTWGDMAVGSIVVRTPGS